MGGAEGGDRSTLHTEFDPTTLKHDLSQNQESATQLTAHHPDTPTSANLIRKYYSTTQDVTYLCHRISSKTMLQ